MYLEYFGVFFLGVVFGAAFVLAAFLFFDRERGCEEPSKPRKVKKKVKFKRDSNNDTRVENYQGVMEDWLYGTAEEDE